MRPNSKRQTAKGLGLALIAAAVVGMFAAACGEDADSSGAPAATPTPGRIVVDAPIDEAELITRESFPQGTVFSMGIHPRRDGKPAGDRGMSGLFQCPKGSKPEPGKHCDSVTGSKTFGAGELPREGAAPKS